MHQRLATIIVAATFLLSAMAQAATIKAVQSNKVLIDLGSDSANEGDLFFAMSPEGKKLGIIKITKTKGARALGMIVKGRAEKGWNATPRGTKQAAKPTNDNPPADKGHKTSSPMAYGGMLGYAMESQSVTLTTASGATATTSMSGNGFSGYGFFDYNFTDMWGVRAVGGIDSFSVGDSDACPTGSCTTSITYGTVGGWGRMNIWSGDVNPWIGAGLVFLVPLSSSSTALASSSINTTYALVAGGGVDWKLSPDMFVPVQVEYAMFAPSSGVTTSWIAVRAGLGFHF